MTVYKEKNFVSAVVYVNNDAERVSTFLESLYNFFDESFLNFEIICVNDGSLDNSKELIKQTAKGMQGRVTLLNMSFYQGLEQAMNAGVDLAIGDFVFEFDSCVSDYPIETVRSVYEKCLDGNDIVVAVAGQRRLTSRLFYFLFNHNAQSQHPLESETFRILSRRAINRIHSISAAIPYRKAIYANCGLKMIAISYDGVERSKKHLSKRQRLNRRTNAMDAMILYTDIAYKMSMVMSGIMMLAAIGAAVYTLVVFILGHPVNGFTTTMLVMTGCFFGVFVIMAIILKYLSLLIDLVFKKQRYLIESVEKQ